MCATYTYKKDAVREKLREAITVYGATPRAKIRPTDLGPVVVPDFAGLAVRHIPLLTELETLFDFGFYKYTAPNGAPAGRAGSPLSTGLGSRPT